MWKIKTHHFLTFEFYKVFKEVSQCPTIIISSLKPTWILHSFQVRCVTLSIPHHSNPYFVAKSHTKWQKHGSACKTTDWQISNLFLHRKSCLQTNIVHCANWLQFSFHSLHTQGNQLNIVEKLEAAIYNKMTVWPIFGENGLTN